MDDLIPSGAASAFADVLRSTGADATLSRIRDLAKRSVDEAQEELCFEHDARFDDARERYAATAEDARLFAESELDREPDNYRGNLNTPAKLRTYVLGGRGRLTLVSRRTGVRFTFKLGVPRNPRPDDCRIFVRVLQGPDNGTDYVYLGTLWTETTHYRGRTYPPRYGHGKRSRVREAAPSAQAASWLFNRIVRGSDEDLQGLLGQADVWHEGVCGRCGRDLTVPESIETGLGPVCAQKEG